MLISSNAAEIAACAAMTHVTPMSGAMAGVCGDYRQGGNDEIIRGGNDKIVRGGKDRDYLKMNASFDTHATAIARWVHSPEERTIEIRKGCIYGRIGNGIQIEQG